MTNTPVEKRKKGISPVWTLPIIALGICIWIAYSSFQNAGIPISIFFEDASGIVPGKTRVFARGIPIGTVTKLIPDLTNRRIKTIVTMDKTVENQLVEDTLFWVVRPEISAASVQGLDTLLSGSYIGIQTGSSSIQTRNFIGLSSPPPISEDTPGLHIKLRAEELGSIQNGSEVYYRNIPIGTVTESKLDDINGSVIINVFIRLEHAHLVRAGSRFSNASGFSVSGKLTNLKVHLESLASLLKGGIVLHTPEALEKTPLVKNGHIFRLYKDLDSAQYGIHMSLKLASSSGITEGETQVIYRGLVAGVVEKIEFNDDEPHTVTAHIMLDPRAERVLRSGTQFWIVRPNISTEGIENLDTLLTGPYITFIPGPGPYQDQFEIQPEPPPLKPLRPGSELVLKSEQSYSLKRGAPVTYKNMKVGEVLDVELDDSYSHFEIPIYIYEKYERLLQPYSVFWYDGGVSINASVKGVKIASHSLSSLMSGGIAFYTPNVSLVSSATNSYDVVFHIHENYESARKNVPSLQEEGYYFTLITEHPESLKKDAPIYYKNIEVGKIVGFSLTADYQSVRIDCLIHNDYIDTVNSSSRFFDTSGIFAEGSLSGVTVQTTSIETILSGGIGYITTDPGAPKKELPEYPLYSNLNSALLQDSFNVTVRFKNCGNLKIGSPVKYKGVVIGNVKDLRFSDVPEEITVTLLINKEAKTYFRQNTALWLEDAEVSFSGIKNLTTVLFGSFITIRPGEGELQNDFKALTAPPSTPASTLGGLNLLLQSKHLGSLQVNSPIYYRQIKVGKVIHYGLSDNFQQVEIAINIDEQYAPLIRENTRFWAVSGTRIEGGLFSGLTISTESIEALLTGGIALATPDNAEMGLAVEGNHRFILHDKAEDDWLDWHPDITVLEKEGSADDLQAPLKK